MSCIHPHRTRVIMGGNKHMPVKKIAVIFVLCLSAAVLAFNMPARNQPAPDEFSKALAQAKQEKKFVLLDFTGSDWCEGCMQLAKEVFATAEFKDYAAKNLVFLEVDFPIRKPQTKEVILQNEKLKNMFGGEELPTLIVLDSNGRQIASWVGYDGGGPKWLIAKIEALKKP